MDDKVYVRVRSETDTDGNVIPTHIIWEDDRVFTIHRVLDRRPLSSTRMGGKGLRFRVRIGTHDRYLYFEDHKWFVERK